MLMKQNVNNDVTKDSPIVCDQSHYRYPETFWPFRPVCDPKIFQVNLASSRALR